MIIKLNHENAMILRPRNNRLWRSWSGY